MDNLLKEAIADAKAVRETALENAKMALEEAFTPKLQSMLSKKIQMEMDDEDEKKDEAMHDDEDKVEERGDDDMEERAKMARDGDELEERGDDELEERGDDEMEEEMEDDVDEGIIEIDGVKYAPVVSEEEDEEEMKEGEHDEDEMDENADLDLEAVIKELEAEINEEEEDDDEEKNEEIEENDVSSDIGKADNKVNKKANDSTGIGKDGKAKLSEGEEEIDEDIDLDEVLKALSEEEDKEEEVNEVDELKSSLEEHRSVIEELRGKLNEVNLLNAKLLFTNKLFRKYGLNNDQKMKVVEQFDRASNLREVKLVYSTLGESFNGARKNEINESKGAASKPVASTKSEKEVITESNDLRDRFKKLANLI